MTKMRISKKIWLSSNALTIYAVLLGIAFGYINHEASNNVASIIADIAVRLMKLIAMPLLFLSLVTSTSHFSNFNDVKILGVSIVKYTLLTTFIATLVAEAVYLMVSPSLLGAKAYIHERPSGIDKGFLATILNMFPDNLVGAFLDNNVLAVVLMAIVLALALLHVKEKDIVFDFFMGLLNAIMKIVKIGLQFLPLAVWAFVTLLVKQMITEEKDSFNAISGLTLSVIAANIIQGVIILPLLLHIKGINPRRLFINVKEALILAFFTRSSMATLPVTLDRSINHARISEDIAKLSLPLCTTINMNGCAQFILIAVYFVSAYNGLPLSPFEHIGMIFLSILAAIGNAGVPMGCFFLASSILASKDIPLYLMGSILPLYTFIDMVETALNVWSDISITKIVDKEYL